MARWIAPVALAVSAASLVVALVAVDDAKQAREELRIDRSGSGATASAQVEALADRLEQQERRVADLATDVLVGAGGNFDGVNGVGPGTGSTGPDGAWTEVGNSQDLEAQRERRREQMRTLVRDLVRETLEEGKKADGVFEDDPKKKPPLDQFTALLDLDPAQKDIVRRAVRDGQEATISLLRTPTADGTVPIERLMDVITSGKPEEQRTQMMDLFGMLATEKIPGSDETYAARIEAVKQRTSQAFKREFSADQSREYDRMGLDPLEIQIPDSPWMEVFKDAMERRKNR